MGLFFKNVFLFNNIDFINVKMMYRKNIMSFGDVLYLIYCLLGEFIQKISTQIM